MQMEGNILFRIAITILLLNLYLFSDDSNTPERNFIDTSHDYITKKFHAISEKADSVTADTVNYTKNIGKDTNSTTENSKKDKQKELNPENVDALFQNEKYINETKKSFLRISTDYAYNSIEKNDLNVRLGASLALNKSIKNLKLYLSGFNQDNVDDITKRKKYDDEKPEIGVSYLIELKNNIETKYSLGIRNLYPYIRGRFSYLKDTGSWSIEPVQTIEYSIKNEFKEDTTLYLDKEIIKKVKFRLEFSRGTKTDTKGMDYDSVASIFWTPQTKTGLRLSQGIYGNTKYEHIINKTTGESEIYSGINNYETTLTFRQNIYRKWLFYEVSPGVSFQKQYDFDPNYRFYIRIDAFFGKI